MIFSPPSEIVEIACLLSFAISLKNCYKTMGAIALEELTEEIIKFW
ncbi:MAG: hypothetical protein AAGA60_25625 [Cyanobacteria bacterium P01_E01_bin.42]